jgi:fatty acid desaturase
MASRKLDIKTILLLLLMYAVLAGNVVLYVLHPLNPVFHVLIGAAGIHIAFTVWHEAVHATVSARPFGNDVVGVLGMLPYMTPYFIQRWVHLEHHAKLNLPDDPNSIYTDGEFITLPFRYFRALGYAKKLLKTDPRTPAQKRSDTATTLLVVGVLAACVFTGHVVEWAVLWFLPVVVGKLVMDWYINYLPHRGLPADRYKGTRIITAPWFSYVIFNHNYHAVHHMWPTVPWHGYKKLYEKKLEYLKSHDVPIERRVFGSRS